MTAPREARSLLRQPCNGPWGRSTTSHGPGRTDVRHQTPRPRLHARLRAPHGGQRRLVGARFGRCDPVGCAVGIATALAACGIGAAVLWSGAMPALADSTPPPATTTSDAPPPDPYTPPARAHIAKPKPVASVGAKSFTPARTYTPPASIARPAVQTSTPHRQSKPVRRHRKHAVRHAAKQPAASTWLAPLSQVVAVAQSPLPAVTERGHPYLWLAGLAFAVLAVAGLSLHVLTVRYFDLRFE
jgi:hypothetical protein